MNQVFIKKILKCQREQRKVLIVMEAGELLLTVKGVPLSLNETDDGLYELVGKNFLVELCNTYKTSWKDDETFVIEDENKSIFFYFDP